MLRKTPVSECDSFRALSGAADFLAFETVGTSGRRRVACLFSRDGKKEQQHTGQQQRYAAFRPATRPDAAEQRNDLLPTQPDDRGGIAYEKHRFQNRRFEKHSRKSENGGYIQCRPEKKKTQAQYRIFGSGLGRLCAGIRRAEAVFSILQPRRVDGDVRLRLGSGINPTETAPGDIVKKLKKAFDFTTILRYFAPEGMINPGVWSTI